MILRLTHLNLIIMGQKLWFQNKNHPLPFVPLIKLVLYTVKDSFKYFLTALQKGVITKLLGDTKSFTLIQNNSSRSIATCSFQTLLLSDLVPLRISLNGCLKWTLPWELHHTWPPDPIMWYRCGIAAAAALSCRLSTSLFWWMQKGVCGGVYVANGSNRIIVSQVTTFPNWGRSMECPWLKALAFFSTLVDKKDNHVCSLLVQNSLL